MNIIEINNLKFSYNKKDVVLDIPEFTMNQGEVIGLLGPNGAGKTTLLECIQGIRTNFEGTIKIGNYDIVSEFVKISNLFNSQFQVNTYFDYIKVWELIDFFSVLYEKTISKNEILKMLDSFGMRDFKEKYVNKLSGGEKQKIGIILSTINAPHLLFLDEPTTGLDPSARKELWEIIKQLIDKGTSMVITTHYMEEVEELCDNICFINQGKIVARGTSTELIQTSRLKASAEVTFGDVKSLELVKKMNLEEYRETGTKRLVFYSYNCERLLKILKEEEKNKINISSILTHNVNLEDVFLYMTGKELKE